MLSLIALPTTVSLAWTEVWPYQLAASRGWSEVTHHAPYKLQTQPSVLSDTGLQSLCQTACSQTAANYAKTVHDKHLSTLKLLNCSSAAYVAARTSTTHVSGCTHVQACAREAAHHCGYSAVQAAVFWTAVLSQRSWSTGIQCRTNSSSPIIAPERGHLAHTESAATSAGVRK